MLTRNSGKFKSVVEFLGMKKKTKKSVSKAKSSTKSKTSRIPENARSQSTKMKQGESKKKIFQRELSLITNSDEGKQLKSDGDFEAKTEISDVHQNSPREDKTRYCRCLDTRKVSPTFQTPLKSDKAFKLCDSVLQELLDEISSTGHAFRTRYKISAVGMTGIQLAGEKGNAESQYCFKNELQQNLFAKITASLDEVNEEYNKKDAFLGSHCLLRPGVRKLLRLRREIIEQISKSACTRRLRPNPRKRRYSDMISSDPETSRHLTSLSGSDRNVVGKKLAEANLQAAFQKPLQSGRRRNNALIVRGCSARKRPRRGVNLHLDWEFGCGPTLNNAVEGSSSKRHTNNRRYNLVEEGVVSTKEAPATESNDLSERGETGNEAKKTVPELHRHQDVNRQSSPWDRVVLGLTCSVVSGSTDDEILVKQLHSSDLSILLQRTNGGAFKIKGLSTNKNSNDEQEFNIALSYRPKPLPSIGKRTAAEKEDLNSFREENVAPQSNAFSNGGMMNVAKKKLQRKKTQDDGKPNKTANREWTSARRNRTVTRQPHPLQVLGLQHLRARAAISLMSDRSEGKIEEADAVKSAISTPFPPFRRNPYRKVVRKVYTGTSTVPIILNRHRSSTSANFNSQSASSYLLPQYSRAQVSVSSDGNTQLPPVQIAETGTSSQNNEGQNNCEQNMEKKTIDNGDKVPSTAEREVNMEQRHGSCPEPNCLNCAQANPASSMCASQLLRLKKQQDDKQQSTPTTPTSLITSGIDAVSKSISVPSISLVQSQQSQRKLNLVQGGNSAIQSSAPSPSLSVEFQSTAPVVNHPPPPTAIVPHALTVLVPSLSPPLSTIAKPQTTLIYTPSPLHLQAYSPTVVPTTKVTSIGTVDASISNHPAISSSNVVGLQQAGGLLTQIPIFKTGTSTKPFSTSASRGRRAVIHKCHIFRNISAKKMISLSTTPSNIVSSIASKPGLLKSLLECGGKAAEDVRILPLPTAVATPLPPKQSSIATTLVTSVSQPPVMSTGVRSDQAHHSRGTWQVGGRAIVLDVSLKKPPASMTATLSVSQQGIAPQTVPEKPVES
ncbi:hypothetical protein Aperf_G00000016090 [Anoplocephala perfoliata]